MTFPIHYHCPTCGRLYPCYEPLSDKATLNTTNEPKVDGVPTTLSTSSEKQKNCEHEWIQIKEVLFPGNIILPKGNPFCSKCGQPKSEVEEKPCESCKYKQDNENEEQTVTCYKCENYSNWRHENDK